MADQSGRKPGRLWQGVLVISLALNLAVVGLVAGAVYSGRIGAGQQSAFDLGPGPLTRALDRADRRAIAMALRRDGDLRRLDLRGGVGRIVDALRQDPFDPEALRSLLAQQNARLGDVQAKVQDALVNQINGMSAQDRAEFADRLAEEMAQPRLPRRRRSGG